MWSCIGRRSLIFLKEIFHHEIPKDPMVVLLGIIPEGATGQDKAYLLQILLVAAIKCITFSWLKPESPSYIDWILKVWEIHEVRLQKEMSFEEVDTCSYCSDVCMIYTLWFTNSASDMPPPFFYPSSLSVSLIHFLMFIHLSLLPTPYYLLALLWSTLMLNVG